MNTIICPTDFSELATVAAKYAADMAASINMSLCLFHVSPLPVTVSEIPIPPYEFDSTIAEANQLIADLKSQLESRTAQKITIYTEVRQGYFMRDLIDYCGKIDPYAVVIGAEAASGFERLVSGAATLDAIAQLNWPVIVVPGSAVFSGIKKIALACDLKDVMASIPQRQIASLVKTFGAELHVLHIGEDRAFTTDSVAESGLLQEMLSDLRPVYHFMEGENIEKTIVGFVDNHNIDMLFVFPKRHSLFEQLFHHSSSTRLVMQSHIPVLSLHENKLQ